MNRLLSRQLFRLCSKPFTIRRLQKLSEQNFIFPFYHLVTNHPSPFVKHLYPVVSIDRFVKDLDFLLQHFDPATLDEVYDLKNYKTFAGKPRFYLTFDDGLTECYSVVAPLLKEKGIQAAFFVNPAFADNQNVSHRHKVSFIIDAVIRNSNSEMLRKACTVFGIKNVEQAEIISALKKCIWDDRERIDIVAEIYNVDFKSALAEYQPYMNVVQLKSLKEDGFIIGSHSYNHPEFNHISEGEMIEEIVSSFKFLEERLKIEERLFSFPFHDIGVPLLFFNFLRHEASVKVSFGTSGMKYDDAPGNLHRIPMEIAGLNDAESIIRAEYFYYLIKSLFGKNRIYRR